MPSQALPLHQAYSREQIHDLFEPGTSFTPQAGSWGLHGIVRIDGRPGNFVLIVTFGQSQGEHIFDESISTEGILRWQAQPRQGLADKTVRALIGHDEDRNSVYLFLRTASSTRGVPSDYTYLGRLKYVGHDTEREKPVHFAWQLLSWPIPGDVLGRMGLKLERERADAEVSVDRPTAAIAEGRRSGSLVKEAAPLQRAKLGENTRSFLASKRRRRPEHEDRALGLEGERLGRVDGFYEHQPARKADDS